MPNQFLNKALAMSESTFFEDFLLRREGNFLGGGISSLSDGIYWEREYLY